MGPLHGVPITVKDNVALGGHPLRNGSLMTEGVVPAADAAVVARVKAAGAIIIGKTTLPEFAHKVLTDSPLHGVTRNPWNLDAHARRLQRRRQRRACRGVAPLAIGTDGGGSIRCPASCTGVIGFKATLGRIPFEQMPDGFANYAFVGPMTRDADDARLAAVGDGGAVGGGPLFACVPPLAATEPGRRGCGSAGSSISGHYRTHPEVARITASAIDALAAQGAIIEALHDPCFDDVFDIYTVIASTAHAARLGAQAERCGDAVTESLRASIARGRVIPRWTGSARTTSGRRLFRAVQRLFSRFDIIATPTMTAPPALLDAGGSVAEPDVRRMGRDALPVQPDRPSGDFGAGGPRRRQLAGWAATGWPLVWRRPLA